MSAIVLTQGGELDIASIPRLMQRLEPHRQQGREVVLDLRGVEFMDTSGLHLVFETQRRAGEEGFRFAIVRGSANLQRLFDIAGFGESLQMVSDPAELDA